MEVAAITGGRTFCVFESYSIYQGLHEGILETRKNFKEKIKIRDALGKLTDRDRRVLKRISRCN